MRLTERFAERVLEILGTAMLKPERDETDYEVMPVVYPAPLPDGTATMVLGIQVALAAPAGLDDHVVVMALCEDPYANDAMLASFVGVLVRNLRSQRAAALAPSNGGAPASGLLLPGGS